MSQDGGDDGERSYLKVVWSPAPRGEPYEFLLEVDSKHYETRRIEYYADGRRRKVLLAAEDMGALRDLPVGTAEEISSYTGFTAVDIDREAFMAEWDPRPFPTP